LTDFHMRGILLRLMPSKNGTWPTGVFVFWH
jgi:hypothetical protein